MSKRKTLYMHIIIKNIKIILKNILSLSLSLSIYIYIYIFWREFQLIMAFTSDDNSLSSDQDTNQPQIFYSTIRDFTSWVNWNPLYIYIYIYKCGIHVIVIQKE